MGKEIGPRDPHAEGIGLLVTVGVLCAVAVLLMDNITDPLNECGNDCVTWSVWRWLLPAMILVTILTTIVVIMRRRVPIAYRAVAWVVIGGLWAYVLLGVWVSLNHTYESD